VVKTWAKRFFGTLLAAVVLGFSCLYGLLSIGPTLEAVRGGGTPGVFLLEKETRGKGDACNWRGTFFSATGEVRRDVGYRGGEEDRGACSGQRGERFPARDTGAYDAVFGGEKTSASFLVGVLIASIPAGLVLLLLAVWALSAVSRVFQRLTGRQPGSIWGRVAVRGRSLRELQEDSRLTEAQWRLVRPRPQTAPPPPGWAPHVPAGLPQRPRQEGEQR
jgi:hypothetical protein